MRAGPANTKCMGVDPCGPPSNDATAQTCENMRFLSRPNYQQCVGSEPSHDCSVAITTSIATGRDAHRAVWWQELPPGHQVITYK
jgi:hypothetical protein